MDYENQEETIDLLELFSVLWQHAVLIVAATLVTGILGFVVSAFFITPKYEASALMIVNTRVDANTNVTNDQITSATKLVDTYSIIIKSDTVLQPVIDNLGLNVDYSKLYDMVTVDAVNNTQVMKVTVTDPNAESARIICEQITQIAPEVIIESVEAGSVKVISQAAITPDPVSPSVMKYTAVAAMLGLVLCAGIIVLRHLLDNKINTEADVTKYLDLPVLGVIPKYEGR